VAAARPVTTRGSGVSRLDPRRPGMGPGRGEDRPDGGGPDPEPGDAARGYPMRSP
jgi:hypothetical protein